MRNSILTLAAIIAGSVLLVTGCSESESDNGTVPGAWESVWKIEQIAVIEGLDLPECVAIDKANGNLYVSNVVTPDESFWVDDNNGFISQVKPDGTIKKLKWLKSTATTPIHDPKGMCILGRKLYFNDNTKIKYISLDEPGEVGVITIEGAKKLNDLATDGKSVWATDTETGKVFCISADGSIRQIPAPASINGITCYQGKVFAVSWDLHEVYELDPTGVKEPAAFGLASHFTALDSIEVLGDNSFIVTDFKGNQLCWISADRKTVRQLAELTSPADVGYDRVNNLLYVPQLLENRVVIYKLTRKLLHFQP
ncbi:MAG: hypothetical protein KAS23_05710 [Anaerohalosphaera sp.]|nr:hypothetical protein [Anaerohalosphaera sp.]